MPNKIPVEIQTEELEETIRKAEKLVSTLEDDLRRAKGAKA